MQCHHFLFFIWLLDLIWMLLLGSGAHNELLTYNGVCRAAPVKFNEYVYNAKVTFQDFKARFDRIFLRTKTKIHTILEQNN